MPRFIVALFASVSVPVTLAGSSLAQMYDTKETRDAEIVRHLAEACLKTTDHPAEHGGTRREHDHCWYRQVEINCLALAKAVFPSGGLVPSVQQDPAAGKETDMPVPGQKV